MKSVSGRELPIHGNKPLKIGLLRHFLKAASLYEEDV